MTVSRRRCAGGDLRRADEPDLGRSACRASIPRSCCYSSGFCSPSPSCSGASRSGSVCRRRPANLRRVCCSVRRCSVLSRLRTGSDWLFAPTSGQNEFLRGIAAFCGVLLVGVAGATIDLGFVRARARTVGLISLGALGVPLVSTVVLALAADPRLHGPEAGMWTFAAYAGLALAVSAVPVIVKIFADLGVLHRNLSQLSLSVAVIDDAVVWIGLSIIAAGRTPSPRRRSGRRCRAHARGRRRARPADGGRQAYRRHGPSGCPAANLGSAPPAWWRRASSPSVP